MKNQPTTSKEVLNDLYKANQQQPESANKIAVDTGIQIIKEYKNTGYLSWEGAAILAACFLIVFANTVTTIFNLAKTGQTIKRNVTAYLNKEDFQDKAVIEAILRDMLEVSQSDRVCLGILHNGTGWGAVHFTKMSVRYEARRVGIESVKGVFKDIDIDRISEEIVAAEVDRFTYFTRDDKRLNAGCTAYLDSLGIKSVYTRLLSSKESLTGKLLSRFIKPKEVGVYAILELQNITEEEDLISADDKVKQQVEELYQKLVWSMERVRKGKKLY